MKIYLDLLPQEKKDELARKKTFRRILKQEMLFLLPFVVLIIILGNIYYVLTLEKNTGIEVGAINTSQEKYQELSFYEDKFTKINESVKVILKIQSAHIKWSEVFKELGTITPQGVTISNFSNKNYQIFLIGRARTRDDLLSFKSKLENSSCFASINVPLSNLVVKNDVDFQMDLLVNQECLKKT